MDRALAAGWETDLGILELTGSVVVDRDDHLVVRSPANPSFHWGNCLLVLDPATVDDAPRWVSTFATTFPDAGWVAVGLARMPASTRAWTDLGVAVEQDDVLSARDVPRAAELPDGYTSRMLWGDADWEQWVDRDMAENERSDEFEAEGHLEFVRGMVRTRRTLSERGDAAFFGAFDDEGRLVAELGVVRCGTTARYQAVGTDPGHRRRGLASHLLGVAARWSADHGCERWVIVTEAANPAGRVYRRAGFEPDVANAQAYRAPAR